MPRCWLVKATSASASTSAGAGASDDAYETGLTAGKTESLSAKKPPKEWEPGDQPTRSEVLDAWFGTEAMRHKADLLDLRRPYVLIASADPTVRAKLYEWAADHWRDQVDLDEVEDGAQLMEMAEERAPAAVIVAFFLAELSGMEVARRLREDPRFSATRIALLMPEGDDDLLGETPHDAVVRMPLRRAEVTERVGPLIALEIADV